MNIFFFIIGKLFEIILWPFMGLPSIFGLTFIALLTGFIAVFIFKHVSNQDMLKRIMNQIKLHFTEIILYRDNIRQILSAQKEILKHNLHYFLRTIKPAILIVPIVLIILSQINIRYSFRPISQGEPITVRVTKADNPKVNETQDVELILPEGFEMVTPAFHLSESRQIEWRVRGNRTGQFDLTFKIGPDTFTKKILIGFPIRPFSPHLGRQGFFEKFFNPLESLLPSNAPIEAVDLGYESRSFSLGVFGWSMHWLVAFLVIAIAFGLVCRKILKVS